MDSYEDLVWEMYNYYWNGCICKYLEKRILPDYGMGGPVPAPVMIIGFNGNTGKLDPEEYIKKYDKPFLKNDQLDEKKIKAFNSLRVEFFMADAGTDNKAKAEEKIKKTYGAEYVVLFGQMKKFEDKMWESILGHFWKVESNFRNDRLKKMVCSAIYFGNAIKCPTGNSKCIPSSLWGDEKGVDFLKKEIEFVNPEVILLTGVDLHNKYFDYIKASSAEFVGRKLKK